MKPDREHIGVIIKRLRRMRGVTGKAVALAVGTTPSHLCAIENGRVGSPRYKLVRALADYFGVTISELAGELPTTHDGLSPEAAQVSYWYDHKLSDDARELVFKMIKAFVNGEAQRTASEDPD